MGAAVFLPKRHKLRQRSIRRKVANAFFSPILISMRKWLLSWILLAVALTGFAEDRPNIVFVLCDDLRADALGCMGHLWAETPNIDKLSFQGVTFDQAYAVSAICVTSRANILTGQYAARSKWRHGDFRGKELTDAQLRQTYLSQLKLAGYRISYAGKWHVGKPPQAFFDDNFAFEGQGRFYDQPGGEHLTSRIASQAETVINKRDERPFFLCVGFKAPHVQDGKRPPFYIYDQSLVGQLYQDVELSQPPLSGAAYFNGLPDFMKRSLNRERWGYRLSSPELFDQSVKGYFRLISGIDHAVGRIVKALEDTGQARNTIVVFSSDHGVYLGARGFAGKWLPHEPSMAIPLIVYDPKLPEAKRGRRDQFALTIDLAPTFLELAGVKVPKSIQGRSLVGLIQGQNPEDWREEFFYEHEYMPFKIPSTEAVRMVRWKYIRYMNSDPLYEELYDMRKDPLEERNLIGNVDYAFVHEMMEKKWLSWHENAKGDL